ncbi:LamG-like jellyroll fold domain-containing protein [Flavilitoribacter nigricans]|uniref:Staphylococcus aureus surface protein A n=1 Tax=Flavilitoribacter nigricans (strain ATCC 23147 / DSM 23189 / NBRC 102662 / NCIMB 1420 / SS-2) TaxID=1122177 RepID=A0A2D0N2G0_FLAN2|nr:LamG-like jellyroll fold domain-containing protein [Flavilitoribacter nigricans]PHN02711.1 hypothetical protein CRP01_30475 [Flavilitoribacter nigricans DSM 23189 = NBRC 102662]
MRIILNTTLLLWFLGMVITQTHAQTASASDRLVAQPIPDRFVPFMLSDPGISKTVEFGADLAWSFDQNYRRALLFMGQDQVDVTRVSYQPTHPLVDGDIQGQQIIDLNWRLSLVQSYAAPTTRIVMNVDAPTIDPSYVGNAQNWRDLVKATATRIQDAGYEVVSVGPMNEPDYSTEQGTIDDFYNIVVAMRNDPFFDDIRISGGNVLNCDLATQWYEYLHPAGVNEGNTHQLAGEFTPYAEFFENVRANGDWASNDELHNVMEALVGYEYGMQMGIWWGPADLARGEMVKAFDGQRIGYAEHRPNWTAAAVYRTPEGKVQAFGGTSERQAATTTYNYLSKERVVYYDGHGPQREFVLEMPGGTGYWTGQSNAERVINITWGDDIQPAIGGRYKLVNRNSGLVMEVSGDINQNGANMQQGNYTGALTQQWDVYPVDSRIGGDFSYYRIQPAANSNKSADLYGFSLDNGGNINLWDNGNGGNQQWYLDYAEDGWFYIRSRESSHCIDVNGASTAPGANIAQWEKLGGLNQQWRLLPVDAPIEFSAPAAPSSLTATANAVSIQLDWTASSATDVSGYHIYRAESAGGAYNTIARDVSVTSFVDNTALPGVTYYYAVKAIDHSLNRSTYSNQVSGAATADPALVAHLQFEDDTKDATSNLNHSATYGGTSYIGGGVDVKSLALNGTDAFVQLPPDVANHQEITVATWVYWDGGAPWQRIFDFGNGTEQNLFLTPATWDGGMQFGIKNGNTQQNLYATGLPTRKLSHVAVTIGASGVRLYLNGEEVASEATTNISPLDFKPMLNYIGRSQYPDPLFKGRIDDFRIYNYALSAPEVAELAATPAEEYTTVHITSSVSGPTNLLPIPVTITFGKEVTGFDLTDVAVGNGIAGNLQEMVPGTVWTVDITPLADGIVTVDVAENAATDLSGFPSEEAEQFSIEYASYLPVISVNLIGNTTTWQNNGPQDLQFAFDGDFNTAIDGWENWGFLGYDFGEGAEASVATWKFAPRGGFNWRLNGTELRGSNSADYLNDFDVLYTIADNPAEGVLTEVAVNAPTSYRYVYWFGGAYSYANIAEFELYDSGNNELIGTPVGFEGGSQWCGDCTYDKALDGDLNTYVEGPQTIGYVGYDYGEGYGLSLIGWKYAPRYGFAGRMDGTELRGSNDPDYLNNYTVISTINATPAEGQLTEAVINDPTPYRYVYWSGRTDSYGNISELELYGELTCIDQLPPTITCPADQTRVLDSNCTYAVEDFTALATNVTDDCEAEPTVIQYPLPGELISAPGVYQITLTATDGAGKSTACSFAVTVEDNETAPVVEALSVPVDPVALGNTMSFIGQFSDACEFDKHTAIWNWGDGTTSEATVDQDANTVGGSHLYALPGVYIVTLTVTDGAGNSGSLSGANFAVVYDPNGNYVTGGGWIVSPAGAYAADPNLAGKAEFGFVSKYEKGTTVPTGITTFQFKAGDFEFESTDYEWLVVAGENAKFKGSGLVNELGDYGFMLTAVDGALKNPIGPDKFRIKIWDKANGDAVVYDNKVGADDDGYDTQVIDAGKIKIHERKGNSTTGTLTTIHPQTNELRLNLKLYPNPTRGLVNLKLESLSDQALEIVINDHTGQVVWRQQYQSLSPSSLTIDLSSDRFAAGVYMMSVITSKEVWSRRLIIAR